MRGVSKARVNGKPANHQAVFAIKLTATQACCFIEEQYDIEEQPVKTRKAVHQ
jgi:hypothetical protein